MQKLKTITREPKLYSFIISPNLLQLENAQGKFQLDPRVIPQSICNVIAYDLDGAFKYISSVVQGKGLSAKHTNNEPLGDFLKLSEQFVEIPVSLPTVVTNSLPPVEVPIKASAENWIAYIRAEAKKLGYALRKIKNGKLLTQKS